MQTFMIQLTVEVDDDMTESDLSSIIVEALVESDHVDRYVNDFSISINS